VERHVRVGKTRVSSVTLSSHLLLPFHLVHLENNDVSRESTRVDISRHALLTSYLIFLYEPGCPIKVTNTYPTGAGRETRETRNAPESISARAQSDVFIL